tara:strand:+ start:148 stop:279 length:132 start_codon:yes stop_codon:yes gene_type:complete
MIKRKEPTSDVAKIKIKAIPEEYKNTRLDKELKFLRKKIIKSK